VKIVHDLLSPETYISLHDTCITLARDHGIKISPTGLYYFVVYRLGYSYTKFDVRDVRFRDTELYRYVNQLIRLASYTRECALFNYQFVFNDIYGLLSHEHGSL
jgi:hypothetical protein